MADVYRDALAATRDRILALRSDVAALELMLGDDVWRYIPSVEEEMIKGLAAATRAHSDETNADTDNRDELLACLQALESYHRALQALVKRLPEIEAACLLLPRRAPDLPFEAHPGSRGDADPGSFADCCARVKAIVLARDPNAQIEVLGGGLAGVRAYYNDNGVPLTLRYQGDRRTHEGEAEHYRTSLAMATTVATATPNLTLRPELGRHTYLLKPLRLVDDVQTGHDTFDGLFLVEGSEAAVAVLLTEEVRAGLLTIARFDVPTLRIAQGCAVISWRFDPNVTAIAGATRALAGVRATPPRPDLRRVAPAD